MCAAESIDVLSWYNMEKKKSYTFDLICCCTQEELTSFLHSSNSGSQRRGASVEISCSILSVSLISRFAFSLSGAQIGSAIVGSSVRQKDIPVPETKNRLRIYGLYNHLCQFRNIAIAVCCKREARIEAGY